MAESPRTVRGVLAAAADYLQRRGGVEHPALACEHLLARLLGCPRLELTLRGGEALDERRLEAMRRGVKRVAGGEPLQYVLGQWDFMGLTFKVDRRALIPRPETESLVARGRACEPLWAAGRPAVVDVGAGCGCIAIALARERPQGLYVGLDVSEESLALARENAEALGVAGRVAFGCGEMADIVDADSLHAVVSNPPYIPSGEIANLPVQVRDHEPRVALDGGADGLAVIGALALDAAMALRPGGFLFLEIGADQGARVTALLRDAGFEDIRVTPDDAGRDRVVSAARPSGG